MLKLRVYWHPQVPREAFHVDVRNLREARLVHDSLANYDLFQVERRIKPDYCNMGGLEVFIDGEWEEWEDPDTCESIGDLSPERIEELDRQLV